MQRTADLGKSVRSALLTCENLCAAHYQPSALDCLTVHHTGVPYSNSEHCCHCAQMQLSHCAPSRRALLWCNSLHNVKRFFVLGADSFHERVMKKWPVLSVSRGGVWRGRDGPCDVGRTPGHVMTPLLGSRWGAGQPLVAAGDQFHRGRICANCNGRIYA